MISANIAPHRIKIESGWHSEKGRTRTNNEDSLFVDPKCRVFVLADGMGGHNGGELASAIVTRIVGSRLKRVPRDTQIARRKILSALQVASDSVLNFAKACPEISGAGTTVVAAVVIENELLYASVGDSRLYLMRDGTLEQLTSDDTFVDVLLQSGQISKADAMVHPMKNQLLNCLGLSSYDAEETPIGTIMLDAGDRLLITSDGITDVLNEEQVAVVLRLMPDPEDCAHHLSGLAWEFGASDDLSCIILNVVNHVE